MSEPFDLLLRGGTCVLPWGDVAVADVDRMLHHHQPLGRSASPTW